MANHKGQLHINSLEEGIKLHFNETNYVTNPPPSKRFGKLARGYLEILADNMVGDPDYELEKRLANMDSRIIDLNFQGAEYTVEYWFQEPKDNHPDGKIYSAHANIKRKDGTKIQQEEPFIRELIDYFEKFNSETQLSVKIETDALTVSEFMEKSNPERFKDFEKLAWMEYNTPLGEYLFLVDEDKIDQLKPQELHIGNKEFGEYKTEKLIGKSIKEDRYNFLTRDDKETSGLGTETYRVHINDIPLASNMRWISTNGYMAWTYFIFGLTDIHFEKARNLTEIRDKELLSIVDQHKLNLFDLNLNEESYQTLIEKIKEDAPANVIIDEGNSPNIYVNDILIAEARKIQNGGTISLSEKTFTDDNILANKSQDLYTGLRAIVQPIVDLNREPEIDLEL